MSLISLFTNAWVWFKKNFINHVQAAAQVAVVITETVKTLLANPISGFLENVADAITGSQVPTAIANELNVLIPKILAVELGVEGLPTNPTPEQILTFEQSILSAFNVQNNNSKLYTVLSAQIYGVIQNSIQNGVSTFAGWVDAVEQAYGDLQKDLAANAPVVTTNPVLPVADQVSPEQLAAEQQEIKTAQPGDTAFVNDNQPT